jgi:multimeric flavodoxin WrbA
MRTAAQIKTQIDQSVGQEIRPKPALRLKCFGAISLTASLCPSTTP